VTAGTDIGGFANSTPWLKPVFDVSGLGGQLLTFMAYDIQYRDNSFETRLLLDNIHVQSAPEPSSFSLFGLGLLGLGVLRQKAKQ
jgi:hypothetical protein